MKLIKYLLPLLALPFFSSLSCGKKPPPRPVHYMTQEFKDYIVFPEGSWWVYENQFGEKDTHRLFLQDISIVDGTNRVSHDYEWMMQHLFTTYYNDTILGWGGDQLGEGNIYYEGYLRPWVPVLLQFFSDKEVGDSIYINESLKYAQFYDSLMIKGIFYPGVKLFQNWQMFNPLQPEQIFYARHIGVVRKELYDGTNWELTDHYINN